MPHRYDDHDRHRSHWRADPHEDRRGPRAGRDETRSFGEHEPWRRDRYGSRFDQDRTAYGSGHDPARGYGRGIDEDHDDYLGWRDAQMRAHDRDYRDWREAQHRRYDEEYQRYRDERRHSFGHTFHQWRAQRNLTGGAYATDIAPGMGGYAGKTAHAGGLTNDQDRPSGGYEPVAHETERDQPRAATAPASAEPEFGKEPPEVQAAADGRRPDRAK